MKHLCLYVIWSGDKASLNEVLIIKSYYFVQRTPVNIYLWFSSLIKPVGVKCTCIKWFFKLELSLFSSIYEYILNNKTLSVLIVSKAF